MPRITAVVLPLAFGVGVSLVMLEAYAVAYGGAENGPWLLDIFGTLLAVPVGLMHVIFSLLYDASAFSFFDRLAAIHKEYIHALTVLYWTVFVYFLLIGNQQKVEVSEPLRERASRKETKQQGGRSQE